MKIARVDSIDSLRALTMLLMVFVNDLTANVPKWLRHAEMREDAMGFSDVIFPAFLFIVGLSISLAITNRISKGDSIPQLLIYILTRAFALIVMGFFHVNLEHYSNYAVLPRAVWQILITLCFFLIWLDYPSTLGSMIRRTLRFAGAAGLLVLAFLYEGGTAETPQRMQMHWGGILGLIGWAYLICACLYLIFRNRLSFLLLAYLLLVTFNMLAHTGGRSFSFFAIGDASSAAITMAGVVITVIYAGTQQRYTAAKRWGWFLLAGVLLVASGLLIRPYAEGISKIRSTPAWVLVCTGIAAAAFALFIFIIDLKGRKNWFMVIRPAGTSTLTCYLLPYIVYALYSLFNIRFPDILQHGTGAIIKSLVFAFIIVQITGLLEKRRLRLKV